MKPRFIIACIVFLFIIRLNLLAYAMVEVTLFEPQTYVRKKGKPFIETDSFKIASSSMKGGDTLSLCMPQRAHNDIFI